MCYLILYCVVCPLADEHLDHVVVARGCRDMQAGLASVVRNLQQLGRAGQEETNNTNMAWTREGVNYSTGA